MRFKDISTPEIYKESWDFRFFLKWIWECLTKIKYDTDHIIDNYDPLKCKEELLWMLGDTVGWKYDDLLHFDDKVIKERGLDVNNYLISPNVNMQQLMETYFIFDKDTDYDSNYLLFSEKHLCNEIDFAAPFFRKICSKEIKNLDRRINGSDITSQKEALISIKQMLLERQQKAKQAIREIRKDDPVELLCANEAMFQLDSGPALCHEFLYNISDEERYDILSSKLGMLKAGILESLNDSLYDPDIMQNLCGLKFVRKDSSKLNSQKRQLLSQVRSGYEVDYQTETMQKALQRIKK